MALQRLKNLVDEVTHNPQIVAESDRLVKAGVTPNAILGVIITAILAALTGGGGAGGIIQLILSLLTNLNPPAPTPA